MASSPMLSILAGAADIVDVVTQTEAMEFWRRLGVLCYTNGSRMRIPAEESRNE